jgi:uncharacterized membrane protein YphA (DoxX/SURF4 family)
MLLSSRKDFMEVLALFTRLFVSLILIIAGVLKIQDQGVFVTVVESFGILPSTIAKTIGKLLPWFELILGIALILGLWPRWSTIFASSLLLIFTLVMAINLFRGKVVECGCFGRGTKIGWKLIVRNCVLIVLLGFVYAYNGGAMALNNL